MSPRWSKLIERVGAHGARKRSPFAYPEGPIPVTVETNEVLPLTVEEVSSLLGPPPGSRWLPYHCPTLFAVLQSRSIWKFGDMLAMPPWLDAPPPASPLRWVTSEAMIVIDLPGPAAVFAAVSLRMHHAVDMICTFDHWPHPEQLVRANDVLQACLRMVPRLRARRAVERPGGAPVWVCDSGRMGGDRPAVPGVFDNRYYIDDSLLPGVKALTEGGVLRIIHIAAGPEERPLPDLANFFADAAQAGFPLYRVDLEDVATWQEPRPMEPPPREFLPVRNFARSDVGGFGVLIPVVHDGAAVAAGGAAAGFRSTSYRGG